MKKFIILFIGTLCMMGGTLLAQNCSDRIKSATRIYEKYKQSNDKQALEQACNLLRNVKSMPGVSESCVKEADRLLKAWKPSSSGSKGSGDGVIKYASEDRNGLGLNDDEVEFSGAGGEDTHIWVTCYEGWKVSNNNDWFDVKVVGDNLHITCTANPDKEQREGKFYVISNSGTSAMIITVLQDEKSPMAATLDLSKEALNVGENAKCYPIAVTTTEEWNAEVIEGEKWCTVEKKNPGELSICVEDNTGSERTAMVKVKVVEGVEKYIAIEQEKHGYRGITQSYFETLGGVWRTTRFFFDLHAGESCGFRIGGVAKRWKYIEFSLLDFNVEYAFKIGTDKESGEIKFGSSKVHVDWEPVIRGYLPLSRRDQCWSLFMGIGTSVHFLHYDLLENKVKMPYAGFLFEFGAEFVWSKKNNLSSRIFYRGCYDKFGYNSIGISFDLYEWHPKYSRGK